MGYGDITIFLQFIGVSAASDNTAITMIKLIIIFAGFFGPFLLIPKTFQLGGSAFSSLTGMVNNKSKGTLDKLRNAREAGKKKKREEARSGNFFKKGSSTNFRGKVNRAVAGAALVPKEGLNAAKIRSALSMNADAGVQALSETGEFNAISGDDAKLYAARATTKNEISKRLAEFDDGRFGGENNRARREEAVAAIMRAQKAASSETFQRARVRAQAKTGTGYQNQETGQFEAWRMLEDINDAYGDDRNGAGTALAEMRGSLAQSGQIAGMAGYGTWAQQLEASHQQTDATRDATREAAHSAIIQDTIDSVPPAHALHGKPASARALAEGHRMRIKQLSSSITNGNLMDFGDGQGPRQATMDDLSGAVAAAAGIYDAMSSASPANASAFANELMGADMGIQTQYTDASGNVQTISTVREYIQAQMMGNDEFINRRRDLSTSTLAQAQQLQAAQAAGGTQTLTLGGP